MAATDPQQTIAQSRGVLRARALFVQLAQRLQCNQQTGERKSITVTHIHTHAQTHINWLRLLKSCTRSQTTGLPPPHAQHPKNGRRRGAAQRCRDLPGVIIDATGQVVNTETLTHIYTAVARNNQHLNTIKQRDSIPTPDPHPAKHNQDLPPEPPPCKARPRPTGFHHRRERPGRCALPAPA